MRGPGRLEIEIVEVRDNRVHYNLTCMECGGVEQGERGDAGKMAMIHCLACKVWMGRRAALDVKAARQAQAEGHEIDLRRLVYELQGKPYPPEG